jgi:ferredoxin-type protein NapF
MGKDTTAASPREGFSRRGFLTGRPAPAFRPLPPGISMEALSACTGCGDCVAACPQQILLVAEGRVAVDFSLDECTFCGACATACPEPVFSDSRAMQHVAAISDACLARRGVTCMTCRDACPENAIRFAPRAGGPFLPVLDAGLCTGCGACIGPCPSNAIAARPREVAHA